MTPPAERPGRRRARVRGALGSALLVVTTAAVVVVGTLWAGAAPAPPSPARAVPVADGPTAIVCPGPPALVAAPEDPGTDAEFDPSPVETVAALSAVAAPGTEGLTGAVLAGAEVAAAPLTARGTLLGADGAVPVSVVAPPGAQGPTALGALHTALTSDGDLRGLAATGCAAPASQGWLVGGGTSVGRSGRLLLANPGTTPSTVDLTVLTPGGPVEPASGRGLVLAPGEQRELLLEGLVGGQDAVAVGYVAAGSPVSAMLVDTRLRGLTPAGAEVVGPSMAPSARQVVPGLDVDERTALTVRVAAPGEVAAVARWQLVGADGPVAEGVEDAVTTVAPGAVVDVRLPPVKDGTYALVVEAEVPVLAAVAVERGAEQVPAGASAEDADDGTDPSDIAWAASTAPLAGQSVMVLPGDDVTARLALSAEGTGSGGPAVVELVDVAADGTTGAPRSARVDAASTTVVDLVVPDGDSDSESASDSDRGGRPVAVLVRPVEGVVHAAMTLTASSDDADDDLVAVVGVPPAPTPAADVLVTSVPSGRWPGL